MHDAWEGQHGALPLPWACACIDVSIAAAAAAALQVTVEYKKEGGTVVPVRVHTILISTQHSPDVTNETIHKELMEHVIKPVVPEQYLDEQTIFHLNPSGENKKQ